MKKLLGFLLLSAALVSQSGCAGSLSADTWCLTNHPRRPTVAEFKVMSDANVERDLAYNEYGRKRCGWKA